MAPRRAATALLRKCSPPSMPSGPPLAAAQPVPAPAVFLPAWQPVYQPVSAARPLVLALLAFPFLSLKMFVWPGPATFAKRRLTREAAPSASCWWERR